MEILLTRVYHARGTNGTLATAGGPVCFTIELPWQQNLRDISCIPEGRYRLVKRTSTRHKQHLLVQDVPDRSDILIHSANNALRELRGCIAPVTTLTGPGCGTQSRAALQRLLERVYESIERNEEVFITIQSQKTENHGNNQSA